LDSVPVATTLCWGRMTGSEMLRNLIPSAVAAFGVLAVPAQADTDARALFEALGMPAIIEIMREEGLSYGDTIRSDLFPGQGGAGWDAVVSDIYDYDGMQAAMLQGLEADLAGVDLDPLLSFFASERGQRIVDYEVSARRALMDDEVEQAAEAAAAELPQTDPGRFALLEEFVAVNDLVESNVMGAMNSNYAFYLGLMEGSAFDQTLNEEEILADVWSQEDSLRSDTTDWVYSYLALAYDPLSDEDIEAYIAISRTAEGRALNRALFSAFDGLFVDISRRLGVGASRFLAGQDI
jgi:hypothetical protein